MAVAFRAAGTLATDAAGSPAVPYPSGLAAGDLLLIQYVSTSASVTPTTPSGWTKLFGPVGMAGSANNQQYVFWKIASGSESGTLTIGHTGSSIAATAIMSAYSGCDGTTPIDVYATANTPTSGTSGNAPSVTTTGANRQILHMYFNWTGNAGVTPNGADTERYDAFDTGVSFVVFELADKLQASSGASGTSTATYGGATSGGMAATIALAPPSGSSPVADFTGTPLTGARPLSVAFTDASTNTPTSWSWTFGDGGTSSSQNPTHSYTAAGTYNVALTATNAFGSDTKTRTGYVTVANPSGTLTKIKWGDHLAVTDEGGGVIRVDYVP